MRRSASHFLLVPVLASFWLSAPCPSAEVPPAVDFDREVRPIFTKHCTSCHGGVKKAADLTFVYPQPILAVVEPGDPENSLLLERVTEPDDELRMPPPEHGPRISPAEIATLRQWIAEGAKWQPQWAYRPPQRRPPPKVAKTNWPRQPIDAFILQAQQQQGLQHAADETPEKWLRRVSLDVIGLPPTLAERAEFLADLTANQELAYEQVVDRLLASPRFGERWASVWFDLVRYADSRGQGEDSHRDIWKYRDWVIEALNNDLPYDEFTTKQIAGDLLPDATISDRLAAAVHRLTLTNEEGGTDDEEFRVAAVLDRVATTWQTWQGTSVGCAQCHDHPYDPIQQVEYYQSTALFNTTADCDLTEDWPTLAVPLNREDYARATQLDREIEAIQEQLWRTQWERSHQQAQWKRTRMSSAKTSNGTPIQVKPLTEHDEYLVTGAVVANPTITVTLTPPKELKTITGVRLNLLPLNEETVRKDAEVGFILSEVTVTVHSAATGKSQRVEIARVIGDEPFPIYDPNRSLDRDNEGYGAYTRVNHPRSAVLLPTEPVKLAPGDTVSIAGRYGIFDLAAFSLIPKRASFELSPDESLTQLKDDTQVASDSQRLTDLRSERAKIASIATPVIIEQPAQLRRDSHLFIRGLFLTKGEQVGGGVPDSLNPEGTAVPNRLAFANWITNPENPLTAARCGQSGVGANVRRRFGGDRRGLWRRGGTAQPSRIARRSVGAVSRRLSLEHEAVGA